jgi:phosphate:Na+ symporter
MTGMLGETVTAEREIANAHSLFNIANAIVAFPLLGPGARLIEWLLPDKGDDAGASEFLRPELLGTPELALAAAREDILTLAERLRGRFEGALDLALHGGRKGLEEAMEATAGEVPGLLALFEYLRRLSAGGMTERQAGDQVRLLRAVTSLGALRETLQNSILRAGLARIDGNVMPSAASDAALEQVHQQVLASLDLAISAFRNADPELAARVQASKRTVRPLFASAQDHLLTRLMSVDPNRARTFQLETDVLHGLKTAFGHIRSFARAVPDAPASSLPGNRTDQPTA